MKSVVFGFAPLAMTLALAAPAHAVSPLTPAMDSFTILPGQTIHTDLNCGTGNSAVSGGALTETRNTRLWRSYPDATNHRIWHTSVTNRGSVSEKVWVNAVCATGFTSYWPFAGSTPTVASGGFGTGSADCGTLRVPMGGGFIAPNDNFVIVSSHVQGNGWRVRVFNGNTSGSQVAVLATCSGSLGTPINVPLQPIVLAPNTSKFPVETCPTGSWLASGGFRATVDTHLRIVTGSLPLSTNFKSWKWNFKNFDTVSHTYEHTLRCFPL